MNGAALEKEARNEGRKARKDRGERKEREKGVE
jgi:hypothetical protein